MPNEENPNIDRRVRTRIVRNVLLQPETGRVQRCWLPLGAEPLSVAIVEEERTPFLFVLMPVDRVPADSRNGAPFGVLLVESASAFAMRVDDVTRYLGSLQVFRSGTSRNPGGDVVWKPTLVHAFGSWQPWPVQA